MIASPINDHACLGPTTDRIVAELAANNPALVDLAARFSTIEDLADWFRSLPQRDDNGDPNELPKVDACRPPQRFQLDSPWPNCYERAGRWVGAAELIDPTRTYRLATVATPNGLHTFPTVDGKPVILDPTTRNALRERAASTLRYDGDIETRRLRLQRLIGTDETKGARADLANMHRAKARGETTWIGGTPIDLAIYNAERALAYHRAELDKLDEFYPPGSDYDGDAGPGPGPFETFAEFSEAYARMHPMPAVRNAHFDDAQQLADLETVILTPRQAIDWIAELAMARSHQLIGGTRRIENGHCALCGVLVLRPICVADARDVALVLALAEREARKDGLGALKMVHSTARAVDRIDQIAAANATAAPRNNPVASLLIGSLLNDTNLAPWLGALTRVAGRIATNTGLEAAKIKLAGAGLSAPVISAFEKELNKEGLTLGPLATPPPMPGSLDAMTPQALAGRWLAQKL